jgi:hypothetical protein
MRLAQASGYRENWGGMPVYRLKVLLKLLWSKNPAARAIPVSIPEHPQGLPLAPLRAGSALMLPPMSLLNDFHLWAVNADRPTGTIKPSVGISRSNLV